MARVRQRRDRQGRLPERHHVPSERSRRPCSARHRGEQPARTDRLRAGWEAACPDGEQLLGSHRILPLLCGSGQRPIRRREPVLEHPRAPTGEEPEHRVVLGGIPLGHGGPLGRAALLERREDVRGHVQHHRPVALDPRRVIMDHRACRRVDGQERGCRDSHELHRGCPRRMDQPLIGAANALPQVIRVVVARGGLAQRWLAHVYIDPDPKLGTPDPQVRQAGRPLHPLTGRKRLFLRLCAAALQGVTARSLVHVPTR